MDSPRLEQNVSFIRWGHWGQPVLLFPITGSDAEEVERMQLIAALGSLLEAGKVKIYSCDSIAGRALAAKTGSVEYRCWLQKQFGEYIAAEAVPAIRVDCASKAAEVVVAGASIGAFNAVAAACRYPNLFSGAIGMSGTYDLERLFGFTGNEDYYISAPMCFLTNLGPGPFLERLKSRFFILAYGQGRWENPNNSGGWQTRSARRRSLTGSMCGAPSVITTGRPGGRCCPST